MLLEIFMVFFKIGMFTIGGGYAMLPIIQKEIVESKGWMSDQEFLDAISLTNSLPGPLAPNAATFVGYSIKKVPGALAAVLGAVSPSILIILFIAMIFKNAMQYSIVESIFNGIRPAVVALILYSVIKLGKSAKIKEEKKWILALAAFIAVSILNIHPILVIVTAALIGIFFKKTKQQGREGENE
ncbi:chromate transporter [Sinanaerobacter sp. ZZT-01]|uniref:chromate transporter n=1 Tax=Sinanaerobacter sp. ZZT-01 TaxID=3111540 RepID=UPI002D78C736|nr:chromate transporter [Sinanaerobacter sp. ZZT-01]WRR94690.1 chromate transporter [Sinanaerobacter sp. ZZT-01]